MQLSGFITAIQPNSCPLPLRSCVLSFWPARVPRSCQFQLVGSGVTLGTS